MQKNPFTGEPRLNGVPETNVVARSAHRRKCSTEHLFQVALREDGVAPSEASIAHGKFLLSRGKDIPDAVRDFCARSVFCASQRCAVHITGTVSFVRCGSTDAPVYVAYCSAECFNGLPKPKTNRGSHKALPKTMMRLVPKKSQKNKKQRAAR